MLISDKSMKAASGLLLTLLLFYSVSFAVSAQAATSSFSGSVFIRSDGNIDPSAAPVQRSGETYLFLVSIVGNVTIQKDNVVIDGAGYEIGSTGIGTETTIGVDISFRTNVTITNMQVRGFVQGIRLLNSSNCNIVGNNISENVDGIRIDNSISNLIVGNNITSNRHGTHPFQDNKFYHNNFIDSTDRHVYFDAPNHIDIWDNGYPSGGNYWSNYTGVDEKKGPSQNEAGSDGIGDTSHIIELDSKDSYPLEVPCIYAPQPTTQTDLLWIYVTIGVIVIAVAAVVGVVFLRKRMKKQI
jgi:parallel beta-helix repeat protein